MKQLTILELYELLQKANVPVFHYWVDKMPIPCITYIEYETELEPASGAYWRERNKVEVKFITATEFDQNLERLKSLLLQQKISYTQKTGYDREENLLIHIFDFEIYHKFQINANT